MQPKKNSGSLAENFLYKIEIGYILFNNKYIMEEYYTY